MGMFEFCNQDKIDKDKVEIVQKKKHELVWLRKERIRPGHTMFSYNTETGEIKVAPVQFDKMVSFVTRSPVQKPKLVIERNCVYRQALNKKNFIKRLIREGIYNVKR